MEHFKVGGMSCAACVSRVEKAVSSVDGVSSCSVNLLTGDLKTEGSADALEIISAVEKAGYTAQAADKGDVSAKGNAKTSDEAKLDKTVFRLIASGVLLILLMYVSMGHAMLSLPLPAPLSTSYSALGLFELLLAGLVMVINQKFFISGFKAVLNKSANMDTLVSLGALSAFVYSTYILFAIASAEALGNSAHAEHLTHELYFESAAMILTLITLGKMLESRAKGKTTDALRSLVSLAPESAVVLKDGVEVTVPVSQVGIGDVVVVRPGGRFPVDAVIIEGSCAADESSLTGESIPVDKAVGDSVSASTVNVSGYVKCRAVRVGEDTTFSQIIRLVSDAAATKAPIARVADKVASVFVPAVIIVSIVTALTWFFLGESSDFILRRAISVLVISCPCALGLATPVAIMVGSGKGATHGILFKSAASLEAVGRAKTVVLDKTGTVTYGSPVVTDIIPSPPHDEKTLLSLAYTLEVHSEHPLAKAVVAEAKSRDLSAKKAENFKAEAGYGITATVDGRLAAGGKLDYITRFCEVGESIIDKARKLAAGGKTPLYFALDGEFLGVIAVSDEIKPDSADAIGEMKRMGLKVVMLTGDNKGTAEEIGRASGVDEVYAELLPADKAHLVEDFKKNGKVIVIGDGINDAPALVSADTGIAIGAGTDVAIDSADVVLVNSRLTDAVSAIKLGAATLRNIKENLFWAFIYNVIGIPLAAGVFVKLGGFDLHPMFAAAAMSLSSVCVVSNALRLNFVKLGIKKNTKKEEITEAKVMTKTVKIEGMMCPHCEAHVKGALEKLEGVTSVTASHKDASAVITSDVPVSDDAIKSTVEALGYKYIG